MSSPNVLLVVLDSVRAANTSLHDHRRETTPFLSSFASEATVYGQARAPSTWSLPSHASIWTGESVPSHGIEITTTADEGHSVWDALGAAGYETGVFSSNVYVTDHPVGLGEPFDTVCGVPSEVPADHEQPGEFEMEAPTGFWYAEQFLDWVDDRRAGGGSTDGAAEGDATTAAEDDATAATGDDGEPWAACVNVMDGHRPYLPLPTYDEWGDAEARRLQSEIGRGQFVWKFYGGRHPFWYLDALERLYDGGIRQADAVVERIVGGLAERGLLDDTLVVITSDHGDGLGEPSPVPEGPASVAHTLGTHEHLTHVPLLVRAPGQTTPRRVDDLATPARFPAAVDRWVAGVSGFDGDDADSADDTTETGDRTTDRGAFATPDGELLVYRRPVDGPKLRTAREFCGDDHEQYVSVSAALYRDLVGTDVEKLAYWDGEAVRVHAHDAQGRLRTGAGDPTVVTDRVTNERATPSSATPREQDEEELPAEVLDHLENIGYR